MSRIRMIVPTFLVSKLCQFDYFFPKISCGCHNSVTVWDIFVQLLGQDSVLSTITVAFGYFALESL